jgi:nucleotide-binding universal stress UspA family protein
VERQRGQEFFLPSAKAYSIIEKIAPPVLVVPKSRPDLKRILICSGGGPYIDNAVRFTSEIAQDLGASITLLTVVPEPPAMHATLFRRQEDIDALLSSDSELARNLRNEKSIIERAGVPVSVQIRHGIVIERILEEVERGDCDLIVVGSWPVRDSWRNYVIGNVTHEIVKRTDRPVLVIRSDKELTSLADRLRRMVTKLAGKQGYTRRMSEA